MKKFDYSFLDNGLLPANLINITGTIYSLKTGAKIRKDEYERIFTELEKIAVVQSVKSSNAIEGIVTSDERIEEIVNQNSKPLNHNENEIAGYRDSLNEIHLHYEDIELSENTILRLHEIMMSYTGTEDAGKYKINENYIVEEDKDGNRKMRFKPLSAKETPEAMEQLILAYHDASNNYNINQLLLIPCFILDFLCIHPFRDGNGRMSRLLTLIENFLSTLYMCYKELDKRFSVVNSNKVTKKARIETTVLNNLTPISKAEICKILPDVSATTVEAVLGTMVKEGLVQIMGSGRNTKYMKK